MEESLEELLENYSEEFTRMPVLCVGMQVYTNSQFHKKGHFLFPIYHDI